MTRAEPRVVDVVHALLEAPSGRAARIAVLSSHQATLIHPSGKLTRVLALPPNAEALEQVINQSLRSNQKSGTDLVLVGGSALDRSRIEDAFPKMQMSPFRIAHLTKNGGVFVLPERKGGDLGALLAEVDTLSSRQEEDLFRRADHDERSRHEESRERAEFVERMRAQPARITPVILGIIFVVFAAQISWFPGGTAQALGFGDRTQTETQQWLLHTLRMGALYSPLVDEGQWWRMLTAGFLHHGLMHVSVNCFALYILGRQLEKVLGAARYLTVYAAALIGGSIGSYYMTDGVSVGASGAIWGLLGAQVALAYGRPPVLPRSMAEAIRPMAMQNVFLNVMISLVPGIDWAAHFGGGLAGGLVLAFGLLHDSSHPDKVPLRVWPLAALAVVVLLSGAALCLYLGSISLQQPGS